VKGKVDDDVFIEDAFTPSRALTVRDNSEIEGGCLVRYPEVLCGTAATRAKREATELESARTRVAALEAENAKLNEANRTCTTLAEEAAESSARSGAERAKLERQVEELNAALRNAHAAAAASDALLHSLTRQAGRVYRNRHLGSFPMLRVDGHLLAVVSAAQNAAAEDAFTGSIVRKVSGDQGILYILEGTVETSRPEKDRRH
jgi:hypothetical protein